VYIIPPLPQEVKACRTPRRRTAHSGGG